MQKTISTEALYRHYLAAGQLVCTDTRKVVKGSLFFALKGGNFNANTFAEQAITQGCSLALVDEEKYVTGDRIVLVDDVLVALQQLANYHRRQLNIPVIAITGSNAKTTHKELISAVLSKKYRVSATRGNLNNHIGVPLTLLEINAEHEIAIVEMGANHVGEIQQLCVIAAPTLGLITNIGMAHLEGFGGPEGVKQAKSELYRYIQANGGQVFINGDDPVLHGLAVDNDKITYGCKKLYDVIGKDFSTPQAVALKYTTRYGEKDWAKLPLIETQITGTYNFINCLAATCVGNYFKLSPDEVAMALREFVPGMNRSQVIQTPKNRILLDAYNANPSSMQAAIENFAGYKANDKLVLLGDMFELGTYSETEHQKLVELLAGINLADVVLVGPEFYRTTGGHFTRFKTTAECMDHLHEKKYEGYTVLIKGSRGMKMETLQAAL